MSSGAYYVMGDIKGGRSFRDNFAAILRHRGVEAPRVLYLGAACNGDLNLKACFEKGLAKTCPQSVFKSLALKSHMDPYHKDAQPGRIEEQFSKADVVFFDGGGIEPLRATFERFGLADHVRAAYERGAYVGGLCAGGSYLASEVVYCEHRTIDAQKGASLIEGTAVSCHMNIPEQYEQRLHRLRDLVKDQKAERAIGVSDNQAVLFRNGQPCWLNIPGSKAGQPFMVDGQGNIKAMELMCS